MILGAYELNRTYCMDNVKGLRGLPDACVDLTVTSPPYDDMDLEFNPLSKNGLRTYNGYEWDFKTLATELYRVTKPGGVCVWVVNDPTIDGSESLASSLQKIYFRRVGWNIHDTMIYQTDKPPVNDKRYQPNFEYMVILSKGAPGVFNPVKEPVSTNSATVERKKHKSRAAFHRQTNGDYVSKTRSFDAIEKTKNNVWQVYSAFSANDKQAANHPAVFPEALARDHITSWSNPGELVLDVFSGSGTTAKMCRETGREFIGFEISQEYTDLANRRLAGAKVPLFDWTKA